MFTPQIKKKPFSPPLKKYIKLPPRTLEMPLFTPSLLKSLDLLKFVLLGCRRRMRGDILDWDKTNWIFDTGKISEMEVRHF